MVYSDKKILDAAIGRIAGIFKIPLNEVKSELVFGEDLNSRFISDFKDNELDELLQDIRDVADKKVIKELNNGLLEIITVGDYCDHMLRCYKLNSIDVIEILSLNK